MSIGQRLCILLLGAMVVIFGLLGYLNVRLHRQHLEQNTLLSAERVSDVIKHSTIDYMLVNDQEGLYRSIKTMASEPGMEPNTISHTGRRVRRSLPMTPT